MHLKLSPVRSDDQLVLHRQGDVLTMNDKVYDFTPLPEGGTLPRLAVNCPWLASDVTRENGMLHMTLILPYAGQPLPDVLDPAAIIDPPEGVVTLPFLTSGTPSKGPSQ